jgi:hypothetical protein
MKSRWSRDEINILLKRYNTSTQQEILNLLPNRSWQSIKHQAMRFSLRVKFKWTVEKIVELKTLYPAASKDAILKTFECSWSGIQHAASRAQISRDTRQLFVAEFLNKYSIDSNGCWIYSGKLDQDGYGRTGFDGKTNVGAHRLSYQLYYDTVLDDDHDVHHECHVPSCIQPLHLKLLTKREHVALHHKGIKS